MKERYYGQVSRVPYDPLGVVNTVQRRYIDYATVVVVIEAGPGVQFGIGAGVVDIPTGRQQVFASTVGEYSRMLGTLGQEILMVIIHCHGLYRSGDSVPQVTTYCPIRLARSVDDVLGHAFAHHGH